MERNNNNNPNSFWQFSDQLRLQGTNNLANLSLNDSIWGSSYVSKRPDNRTNFDVRVGEQFNNPDTYSNTTSNTSTNGKLGSDWNGFNDTWKININSRSSPTVNVNSNNFDVYNNNNNNNINYGDAFIGGGSQKGLSFNDGLFNINSNRAIYSKSKNLDNNFNVNLKGFGKNNSGSNNKVNDDYVTNKKNKSNKKNVNSNGGGDSNSNDGRDSKNGVDKRFKTLPPSESLQRNETVGGYIFVCNNDTMQENLQRQLFGLPPRYRDSVRQITPGLPLFLYNYSTHQLHGIFEAASFGGTNIDPVAWEDKKYPGESRFPAQVRVNTRKVCEPLEEDSFRPILYHYDGPKFRLDLNVPEALSLLDIFAQQDEDFTKLGVERSMQIF